MAAVGIPVSVDFESGHVAATGNIERSELGNTDQTFLSNDPDTRSGATGPIPASVYNAMFTDPTNQNIESPALPSELRFDLDSYNGPSTLTSNGGFSPDVYCNVNGQRPS